MKTHHAGRAATSLPEKFTPPAGLSPELADSLAELTALRTQNLSDSEQHARLWSVLSNLAQVVAETATGDVLPLASFRAWILASHIVHERFGLAGEVAWGRASGWLAGRLSEISAGASGGPQA
ncbi:hypothetical protein [Pantoea sp. At-9b]|uniref:hypothetical protein n=1 Tax=Pantoea sp. (strain At-9b) TaxID=592316 RepID=UPI0001B3F583|nr:hypothetical protein [Pantoea sp. At-9b]ADU73035.1 hypothetical protein Pat9b_4054 [Pantoea sp. At-9b]